MAGKRIYITIPRRDALLLQRVAMMGQECVGMAARRWVLQELYRELALNGELQEYDAQLAAEERAEVLRGRRG